MKNRKLGVGDKLKVGLKGETVKGTIIDSQVYQEGRALLVQLPNGKEVEIFQKKGEKGGSVK